MPDSNKPEDQPIDNTAPDPADDQKAADKAEVVNTHEQALKMGYFGESPSYDEMKASIKQNDANDAKRAKADKA